MGDLVVTDLLGREVLPSRDEWASVSSWSAVQAIWSADLRVKSGVYRRLAAHLFIRRVESGA